MDAATRDRVLALAGIITPRIEFRAAPEAGEADADLLDADDVEDVEEDAEEDESDEEVETDDDLEDEEDESDEDEEDLDEADAEVDVEVEETEPARSAADRDRLIRLLPAHESRMRQADNTGSGAGGTGKSQDQSKHPHVASGPKGGQFTSHGGGGSKAAPKAKAAPSSVPQAPATPRTMKQGDSGEDVRYAQYAMSLLGFKVNQNGSYDAQTAAAVKEIQSRLGVAKPNGHLSASQLHKLQDAVRLSPCVGQSRSFGQDLGETRDLDDGDIESRHRELVLLGIPVRDLPPDDDNTIDDETRAILEALDEWVERQAEDFEERAHDVGKELRIPGGKGGGRWTANPIGRAISDALDAWGKGKGPDDPFVFDGKPIDREPLRKAAVARGITLKRGASRDDIVKALLGGAKDEVVAARTERQKRRAGAKFSINGPDGRKIDVAVYTGADPNAPVLREVTSANRPGRTLTSQPDLAGLEKWANDNGHTDVAQWAASERARAEAKSAPKAAGVATGDAALRAAAVDLRSAAERKAYADYVSQYRGVNGALRDGGGEVPAGREFARDRATIAGLDSAMKRSGLPQDALVYRVGGTAEFPGGRPTVGAEWTDHGFVSTSTTVKTDLRSGETQMRISVPAGTRAVSASELDANEILLDRGSRFLVTKVDGPDARGNWHVDAEVVGSRESAPKVPAKKAAAKAVKGAPKAAPAKRVPKVAKADVPSAVEKLNAAKTKDEGRAALEGLTLVQLTEVSKQMDLAPEGRTKAERIDRLLAHTVGGRQSVAIGQSGMKATPSTPHPAGPAGGARPKGEGGAAAELPKSAAKWHPAPTPAQHDLYHLSEQPDIAPPISAGNPHNGRVEIRTTADGKVVFKAHENRGVRNPKETADAEQLSSLVSEAVGVGTPTFVRTGDSEWLTSFIDGTPGVDLVPKDAIIPPGIRDTPDGRRMGLLDLLIKNGDRNPANWYRDADGNLIAYDHGHAFTRGESPRYFAQRNEYFSGHFAPTMNDAGPNDIPRAEAIATRDRLLALRPDFQRLGRDDWWQEMMGTMDQVLKWAN